MFARKVSIPVVLISPEAIASCKRGVLKRITKERRLRRLSDEEKYKQKRTDNIKRLIIIRDELRELIKQIE
jgi:hypothetical protein